MPDESVVGKVDGMEAACTVSSDDGGHWIDKPQAQRESELLKRDYVRRELRAIWENLG